MDTFYNNYSKIEVTNGLLERTDYQYYPIASHSKKMGRPNRRSEYASTSAHRSLNFARSILLGNFDTNSYFLTLTFKPTKKFNTKNINDCDKRKVWFVRNLEKFYPGTKYFIVPELHKTGVVHYHVICNLPYKLNDQARAILWSYGFSTMKPIKEARGLLYLVKYLGKSFKTPQWFGRRRFYVSIGLTRASRMTESDSYSCVQFIDSWKLKPVVTSRYCSPFHGAISYNAYLVGKNWMPHVRGVPFGSLTN